MAEADTRPSEEAASPGLVCFALLRLSALGAALAWGGFTLLRRSGLEAQLLENEMVGRDAVIWSVVLAVGISTLGSLTLVDRGRLSFAGLVAWSTRLTPLLPVALLPSLLHWPSWVSRPLEFLLLALGVGTLAFWSARAALSDDRVAELVARTERRLSSLAGGTRGLGRVALAGVLLGSVLYAVYFSLLTLQAHENGHTRSYDLGIFANLMWNLAQGDLTLFSSPAMGPTGSHFGRHATLLAYPLAPVYALYPRPETLLVLQAVLLGAAALPLYLFARRGLGPGAALFVAIAYLAYPPLHGANLYDFHFLTLAPLFVFLVAHALASDRPRLLGVAVVLCLALREEMGLVLAALGLWQLATPGRERRGAVLVGVGLGAFVALKLVAMPLAGEGTSFAFLYGSLMPPGEGGLQGVVRTLLSNPFFVLPTLLTGEKLLYAMLLFTPLVFLPFRRPVGLCFALPGFLFTLLVPGYPPVVSIAFQYTAFWTPLLLVAAALQLQDTAWPDLPGPEAARRRRSWIFGIALSGLLCSYQFGAILQRNTAGGGFHDPYPFETTARDLARREAREELLALLPEEVPVAASEGLVPHLTDRRYVYTLRYGVHDARYVAIALESQAPADETMLQRLNDSGEFAVAARNEHFALLRRTEP